MKPAVRPPLIRPIVDGDFAQWLPLWTGYNTFYKRTLPDVVTRATWSRFLDPTEPMHALVAERDGALIGLVHYLYHRATAMIENTWLIPSTVTVPRAWPSA